ncbi:MAG: hypothetical protein QM758_21340 [Armatimonas sp.]
MMTRRTFSLFAATLPLGLLCRRVTSAESAQSPAQNKPPQSLAELSRRSKEWEKANHLPVALIHKQGDYTLYSSAINSILCWADVGSATWLGTQLGVKRVSREPRTSPRHYTRADGLPGEKATAIVADTRGAYALIDLGEEEALCAFEVAKDTWKTLARWSKGDYRSGFNSGKSCLALGRDVVLAAPSVLTTKTDSPLVCFDRERHEARSLPWDPVIRSDHIELSIGFLACREKTALLGTSIGLIEVPLSTEGGPWKRSIEGLYVTSGVEGGGRIYLWLTLRDAGYPDLSQKGYPRLYDPVSGQLQELPVLPSQALSDAVVEEDGTLWLVKSYQNYRRTLQPFSGPSPFFWRWKPGEAAWSSWDINGKEVPAEPRPLVSRYDSSAPYELMPIPGAETIPDGPARLVASNAAYSTSGRDGGSRPATRWLKERFPYWVSLEDPDFLAGAELFRHIGLRLALPDPKNPQSSWQGAGQGAIVEMDSKAVKGPIVSPENRPVNAAGATFISALPEAPKERVSLPSETLNLHARLREMFPLQDGSYLALGEYPFHVSANGRHWRELTPPPQERTAGIRPLDPSDTFFAIGKNIILGTSCLEKNLLRFDSATGELVRTEIVKPTGGPFVGADDSGAWWYMRGNRLLFLAAGTTTLQERTIAPPNSVTLFGEPKLCAGRLWWCGYKSGGQYVGWDPRTNTWTSVLQLPRQPSNMTPIAESNGDVLVASADNGVMVWRWSAKKDTWTTVTATAWGGGEAAAVVTVGEDGIWVLDRNQKSLAQCDPQTTLQKRFPLPVPESRDWEIRLWEDKGDFFLTGKEGLWRFDRRKRTWTEWKVPTATTQLLPQLAVTNGTALWGFLNARNAGPAPLFRFEPSTRRFAFFDESVGAQHPTDGFLAEAGGHVWLLHAKGAFRFDNPTQRFVCELPFVANRVAAAEDNSTVWIARELDLRSPKHPTLYRWSPESGKVVPENASIQSRCNSLLPSKNGVLIAASDGLFCADTQSANWKRINTWGLSATRLLRDAKGAVWATLGELGYLRIHESVGL